MSISIKKIEDLSLNAWPSHQIEVYDGWILRYSYFYTHRTNCVEQIGPSALPLNEKIRYCEEIYKRWHTPCIFKISPITEPSLDMRLEKRGYRIEHPVEVMTHPLCGVRVPTLPDGLDMRVSSHVDSDWISRLFELKGDVADIHRKIVPGMYAAIPKDEIAVTVLCGEETCGIGLGILDRDCVGVYAINVSDRWRRNGIASAIVCTILCEAKKQSAESAYLQVVEDNFPAKHLYRKLGFSREYRCYFRVHD